MLKIIVIWIPMIEYIPHFKTVFLLRKPMLKLISAAMLVAIPTAVSVGNKHGYHLPETTLDVNTNQKQWMPFQHYVTQILLKEKVSKIEMTTLMLFYTIETFRAIIVKVNLISLLLRNLKLR